MDARICSSVRYITHLYCLAVQVSFYSGAVEIWICMQSRCKDHWQFFIPFDILWLSVGPCLGCAQQRDCLVGCSVVPSRFGDESYLDDGNCHRSTVRVALAQWSEFSHGMRDVLGSNHRSDHILFPHM